MTEVYKIMVCPNCESDDILVVPAINFQGIEVICLNCQFVALIGMARKALRPIEVPVGELKEIPDEKLD